MIKVGISTFTSASGKSGVGQYVINLLRAFQRMKSDIEFHLFMKESDQPFFDFNSNQFISHTIPDYMFKPFLNIIYHQKGMQKLSQKINLDILHLPSIRRLLFRKARCPSIATVHDLAVFHLSGKYDFMRTFYNKRVALPMLNNIDHVLTVSEFTKNDLIKYGKINTKKITVIPNGVDHSKYHPIDKNTARRYIEEKYKIDTEYILYTARLEHPAKNHCRLLRSFAEVIKKVNWNGKLVLAGSPWAGAEEIYKIISELSLKDRVVCAGFVPEDDLPYMYSAASIFVFPSLFEGFGIPPIEAMASGTPVACSNAASLPEVVGDAGILFDPLNESTIESAIINFLRDKNLKSEYITRGIDRAKQYSWELSARKTLDAYLKTMSEYKNARN